MVFNKFELEILMRAIRREREMVEKDYIMATKNELNKDNDNGKTGYICIGLGEASKNLQVVNGILIKLEGEFEKYRY